jgi:hypothetical protein
MAKRRELKKNVNYIASELFTECFLHNSESNKDKVDELLMRILLLQNEFLKRISHTEPGAAKKFYRKFNADFKKEVNELINAITELN